MDASIQPQFLSHDVRPVPSIFFSQLSIPEPENLFQSIWLAHFFLSPPQETPSDDTHDHPTRKAFSRGKKKKRSKALFIPYQRKEKLSYTTQKPSHRKVERKTAEIMPRTTKPQHYDRLPPYHPTITPSKTPAMTDHSSHFNHTPRHPPPQPASPAAHSPRASPDTAPASAPRRAWRHSLRSRHSHRSEA